MAEDSGAAEALKQKMLVLLSADGHHWGFLTNVR